MKNNFVHMSGGVIVSVLFVCFITPIIISGILTSSPGSGVAIGLVTDFIVFIILASNLTPIGVDKNGAAILNTASSAAQPSTNSYGKGFAVGLVTGIAGSSLSSRHHTSSGSRVSNYDVLDYDHDEYCEEQCEDSREPHESYSSNDSSSDSYSSSKSSNYDYSSSYSSGSSYSSSSSESSGGSFGGGFNSGRDSGCGGSSFD